MGLNGFISASGAKLYPGAWLGFPSKSANSFPKVFSSSPGDEEFRLRSSSLRLIWTLWFSSFSMSSRWSRWIESSSLSVTWWYSTGFNGTETPGRESISSTKLNSFLTSTPPYPSLVLTLLGTSSSSFSSDSFLSEAMAELSDDMLLLRLMFPSVAASFFLDGIESSPFSAAMIKDGELSSSAGCGNGRSNSLSEIWILAGDVLMLSSWIWLLLPGGESLFSLSFGARSSPVETRRASVVTSSQEDSALIVSFTSSSLSGPGDEQHSVISGISGISILHSSSALPFSFEAKSGIEKSILRQPKSFFSTSWPTVVSMSPLVVFCILKLSCKCWWVSRDSEEFVLFWSFPGMTKSSSSWDRFSWIAFPSFLLSTSSADSFSFEMEATVSVTTVDGGTIRQPVRVLSSMGKPWWVIVFFDAGSWLLSGVVEWTTTVAPRWESSKTGKPWMDCLRFFWLTKWLGKIPFSRPGMARWLAGTFLEACLRQDDGVSPERLDTESLFTCCGLFCNSNKGRLPWSFLIHELSAKRGDTAAAVGGNSRRGGDKYRLTEGGETGISRLSGWKEDGGFFCLIHELSALVLILPTGDFTGPLFWVAHVIGVSGIEDT